MSDPIKPALPVNAPPGHYETIGQRMRDETELDDLKDEIGRNLKGETVALPWRTGRPLRGSGLHPDPNVDRPFTPLEALDLHATVPPRVADTVGREFDRAAIVDAVSEGVLDTAAAMGHEIIEQETWDEAEARRLKELEEAQNGSD